MSQAIGNTALAYARVWHHVDASEPDCGDYVVVTNARQVKVTGNKAQQLVYRHHTMFPGGLKEIQYKDMMRRKPDEIIRQAVSGMLPKNKLRERRLQRLRIFEDGDMGVFQANILKRWEDGTLPAKS
ncbi:60S ribosomal protein L23 [Amylocystis lapponica]|nr:60S ribosomal protein L23 [Amylocystis lapponica]